MTDIEPKPGDIWARVSYGEIVSVEEDQVTVKNDAVGTWTIKKAIVMKEFHFAGHIHSYVTVKASDFEKIFKQSVGSDVFRVKFTKKPSDQAGVEAIDSSGWNDLSVSKKRKVVRDIMEGEERVLDGRLDINPYRIGDHDPESLGRMQVIDMREEPPNNKRQVDLRTIKYLIVRGVCYHLEKEKP